MHAAENNQEPNDQATQAEIDACLLRISRELDRFVIVLMEIEHSGADLIAHAGAQTPVDALNSMQRIDYLAQCSSAMSGLLAQMATEHGNNLTDAISAIVPTDLADRLRNQGLDDIDNTTSQSAVF